MQAYMLADNVVVAIPAVELGVEAVPLPFHLRALFQSKSCDVKK
jgi:hypothetical protein